LLAETVSKSTSRATLRTSHVSVNLYWQRLWLPDVILSFFNRYLTTFHSGYLQLHNIILFVCQNSIFRLTCFTPVLHLDVLICAILLHVQWWLASRRR